MGPKFGKKDKLGLGKCHLRKCLYFAIFINYIFCSIIQLNTWCVFYHSIQPKNYKNNSFFLKHRVGHIASNPFLQEIRQTKRDRPNK